MAAGSWAFRKRASETSSHQRVNDSGKLMSGGAATMAPATLAVDLIRIAFAQDADMDREWHRAEKSKNNHHSRSLSRVAEIGRVAVFRQSRTHVSRSSLENTYYYPTSYQSLFNTSQRLRSRNLLQSRSLTSHRHAHPRMCSSFAG